MTKANPMHEHHQRALAEKKANLAKKKIEQEALFQRHRTGSLAPKPSDEDIDIPSQNADQTELRLFADMARLKAIQSITAKRELKAELLPNYLPFIEGTLSVSPAPQNNALLILMVWALDAGNYAVALQIATHALLNDMAMPDPYTRDVATVFAEQLADSTLENSDTIAKYSDILEQAVELLKSEDIVDQVRAKLYKAYAISIQAQRPSEALAAFEIALKLDKGSGVKKMIEVLTRAIKRGDPESAPDTLGGSQDTTTLQNAGSDPASTAQLDPTTETALKLDSALGGDVANSGNPPASTS